MQNGFFSKKGAGLVQIRRWIEIKPTSIYSDWLSDWTNLETGKKERESCEMNTKKWKIFGNTKKNDFFQNIFVKNKEGILHEVFLPESNHVTQFPMTQFNDFKFLVEKKRKIFKIG